MRYTEQILKHPEFQEIMREISELEKNREYCHHELSHALDVCRMAWIMWLEDYYDIVHHRKMAGNCDKGEQCDSQEQNVMEASRKQNLPSREDLESRKDHMYVAGLLHDIGRAAQYTAQIHHSIAGGELAEKILTDIAYPEPFKQEILDLIGMHHGRTQNCQEQKTLSFYICRADHLSRNCFSCKAAETCKWTEEERNHTIFC